ncbi:MAG: anti-anti-sigma factor, partial [Chloroflexus aggregans]
MIKYLAPLITMQARTPDEQRRGQILVTLSLGTVVILLTIGILLTLFQPTPGRFINLGLATLVFATAAWLGRKGFVTAGSYVLIVVSGIGALSGMFLNPNSPFNLFYLLLSILLASVLLRPNQIWVVLGLALAALGGVILSLPSSQRAIISLDLAAAHLTVLLTVSALITFIGARSLATALEEARQLRQQAEAAN